MPEFLAKSQPEISSVELPVDAYAPGVRKFAQLDRLAAANKAFDVAQHELAEAERKLSVAQVGHDRTDNQEFTLAAQQDHFSFEDEFNRDNPDAWKLVGDGWEFKGGRLHQTASTRGNTSAKLLKPIPRDFELTLRYVTTGGDLYKSVTVRFDQDDKEKYSNFVYTSAHAPGPKLQVAFMRNGTNAYPHEGRKPRPIEVGKPYELRIAVRGELVNVWIDGEFMIAYRLPDRRPNGVLSLSGFDATVAFDRLSIRALPTAFQMRTSIGQPATTPSDLQVKVDIAKAATNLAAARRDALRATIDADNAKYRGDSAKIDKLAIEATKKQLAAEIAAGQHDALIHQNDEEKRTAAEKRSQKAVAELRELENGGAPSYATLRVSKKALETPEHKESDYPAVYPTRSSGRRLALAQWITSRDNPLTARVAVNHVWMRHFGKPLVESVFDFGLRAKKPVQMALLDFLADEFIISGWSFRHLHRLIVCSEAYQLSSSSVGTPARTIRSDPTNETFWRMPTRRMESQVIRDSLLQLAGKLDTTIGGPSIAPNGTSLRRSVYFLHSRDQKDKFLGMFDDADLLQCYRRKESIVPQQALALSNSKLANEMSMEIAKRIGELMKGNSIDEFLNLSFEYLLCRVPTQEERDTCLQFVESAIQLDAENRTADNEHTIARRHLIHALINHNDFITIR